MEEIKVMIKKNLDYREYLPSEEQSCDIDVSIYILTYYHEKYIRQALESVLAQKTRYRYEIVISDDHSTDGTMDILKEYKSKYPDIFTINYNDENLGIPANIYKARCMCRGRYIVNLAGDDYWINNNKLEKEVQFLDNHPEYIVLCSRVELRYDDELKCIDILPAESETDREFTIEDFEKGKNFNCHGLMMRNFFRTEKGRSYFQLAQKISNKVDDAVDNLLLLRLGRVYTLNFITDAYRIPSNKSTQSNYNSRYSDLEKTQHEIQLYNGMFQYFGNEINFKKRYTQTLAVLILRMLRERKFKEYKEEYMSIPEIYRKPFFHNILWRSMLEALKVVINKVNIWRRHNIVK